MMNTPTEMQSQGAVSAILEEYEKAMQELVGIIKPLSASALSSVRDAATEDSNCRSIQTVLAHVVRSGYTYAILINSVKAPIAPYREKIFRTTASDFVQDLRAMLAFTVQALRQFQDHELEAYDVAAKFLTPWGQAYDVEQMMEHAIVHVLRHRRQIVRWLAASNEQFHATAGQGE